jgi:site-specific recombinase XerD
MARKRKLDKHVSVFVDRHGKERFRFRKGSFSTYLPHPTDKLYRQAYDAALARNPLAITPRSAPGTIDDALPRFYDSLAFKRGGEGWQKDRRRILDAFRAEYGRFELRHFEPHLIERILEKKLEQRVINGRRIGGSAAAVRLREQLLVFFRWAKKQKLIASNPVEEADTPDHKEVGYYKWTEEDIAAFRAFWKLGTKPRLALELVLWTGSRRKDAHMMAPPKNGRIGDTASKTGKGMDVKVAPALQEAIDAMPAVGITTLLVTEYGEPFSVGGFGNWFKDKCRRARLPQCSLHGLRKALARRAADLEASQQQIKALGQWSNDSEVKIYVEGANRRKLAESALDAVIEWERRENIG